MTTPQEHNRRAWDALVREKQHFTLPAPDRDFHDPQANFDPLGWLPDPLAGKRVLCLGAGGGKHGPLYAATGAEVTVLDISPAMLALDRAVAAERGISFRIIEGSIDDLSIFGVAEFDVVIHPVSTCYVPQIALVYREVARVLMPGGVYVSQHKTPTNLQATQQLQAGGYALNEPYYREGALPPVSGSRLREEGTLEFLHRWEEIVGQLCRQGFVIEDLVEPCHADPQAEPGSFGHRCRYIAPYVRIKARRTHRDAHDAPLVRKILLPE
jgi:SAM-dependent methyltransferase